MLLQNLRMEILKKLTLLTSDGIRAFDVEDIKKHMDAGVFEAFGRWFAGQTGIIIEGKYCVYESDLIRYLSLREQILATGTKKP